METVRQLDRKLEAQYAKLPSLPSSAQLWLAQNIWWLVLIGAILAILGQLAVIRSYFVVSSLVGIYAGFWGYGSIIATIYSLVTIAIVVLLLVAVGPLRREARRGWDLLFLSSLFYLAAVAVYFVLTIMYFNIGTLIGAVISTGLGLYVLYQIKSHFLVAKTAPVVKPALKKPTSLTK